MALPAHGSSSSSGTSTTAGISPSVVTSLENKVIIDQSDIYTEVFSLPALLTPESSRLLVSLLIEYIRCLIQHHIPVQHYLYELLLNTLVKNKQYYQLHQFIQYFVVSDSKPLVSFHITPQKHFSFNSSSLCLLLLT